MNTEDKIQALALELARSHNSSDLLVTGILYGLLGAMKGDALERLNEVVTDFSRTEIARLKAEIARAHGGWN